MVTLGRLTPPPEAREDSYTDDQVAAAVARARGAKSSALAAVEAAAGLWERAFASGESDVLSPAVLGIIGRSLLLRGESLWRVRGSQRPRFEAAASWDVSGTTGRPDAWSYRLNIAAPSRTNTAQRVSAGSVAHFRIGVAPGQPWKGCSPLANAALTRTVLANLERTMSLEAGGPVGHVLPVPAPSAELADDVAALDGAVYVGESGLMGMDESRRPTSDWRVQRIGYNAPASVTTGRDAAQVAIFAACGIPLALVAGGQQGGGREAWRQFLYATVAPVGLLIGEELRRLGFAGEIGWTALGASDVQGRARAYQALTGGGMADTDARRVAGVE